MRLVNEVMDLSNSFEVTIIEHHHLLVYHFFFTIRIIIRVRKLANVAFYHFANYVSLGEH